MKVAPQFALNSATSLLRAPRTFVRPAEAGIQSGVRLGKGAPAAGRSIQMSFRPARRNLTCHPLNACGMAAPRPC